MLFLFSPFLFFLAVGIPTVPFLFHFPGVLKFLIEATVVMRFFFPLPWSPRVFCPSSDRSRLKVFFMRPRAGTLAPLPPAPCRNEHVLSPAASVLSYLFLPLNIPSLTEPSHGAFSHFTLGFSSLPIADSLPPIMSPHVPHSLYSRLKFPY